MNKQIIIVKPVILEMVPVERGNMRGQLGNLELGPGDKAISVSNTWSSGNSPGWQSKREC